MVGHVERMDEYRMARRVLMAEVSSLGNRGMTMEASCASMRK